MISKIKFETAAMIAYEANEMADVVLKSPVSERSRDEAIVVQASVRLNLKMMLDMEEWVVDGMIRFYSDYIDRWERQNVEDAVDRGVLHRVQ